MIKKIAVVILFAIIFIQCGEKTETKEILFVCTHGAARSPIATAYFNKLAKEQGLNYHADFRGTEPDAVLTKETIAGLSKDGFDIRDWKPEKVSGQDVEKAYKVVTFDLSLPAGIAAAGNENRWNGTPSISKDYEKARDAIKDRVEELIVSLKDD